MAERAPQGILTGIEAHGVTVLSEEVTDSHADHWLTVGVDSDDGEVCIGAHINTPAGAHRRSVGLWLPREAATRLRDALTLVLGD